MPTTKFSKVKWGDGLTVTDEGAGVIRLDAGVPRTMRAFWAGALPTETGNGLIWRVPSSASGTALTFNLMSAFARLEAVQGSDVTFEIEKSVGGESAFSGTAVATVTVAAGNYEGFVDGLSGEVTTGNLLRLVYAAVGDTATSYQVELLGEAT